MARFTQSELSLELNTLLIDINKQKSTLVQMPLNAVSLGGAISASYAPSPRVAVCLGARRCYGAFPPPPFSEDVRARVRVRV